MSTLLDNTIVNPPDQNSYQFKPGKTYIETQLEGGAPRVRKDYAGAVGILSCNFSCNPQQYTYLMGFFRQMEQFSNSFRMNLKIDSAFLVPYLCQIIGDPPYLSQNDGDLHVVTGTFAITPNPIMEFEFLVENVTAPRFVNLGVTSDGDGFVVGKTVRFAGHQTTVNGVAINLDGDYVITSQVDPVTWEMSAAAGVNSAWTTLGSTTAKEYLNPLGSIITVLPT